MQGKTYKIVRKNKPHRQMIDIERSEMNRELQFCYS